MNLKIGIIFLSLLVAGCGSPKKTGTGDSSEYAHDTDEECPGGMGESACCDEDASLCGTSLTGENCCDVATEQCATCWDGEEYTTCLPIGEDCQGEEE
jgi:hypothetical protein